MGWISGSRSHLQTAGNFFAKQRHLAAVRDGVLGALPLVLTGSLFLLLAKPPSMALQAYVAPYAHLLLVPYRMLSGLIALYVTFSAAHSLARSYDLDAAGAGLLALAAYLVAAFPTPSQVVDAALKPGFPLSRLGAGGIFGGLVIALGTVEVLRLLVRRRWTLRLPASAPEAVMRSFAALIPSVVVITLVFLAVHVFKFDFISVLEDLARPLLAATGSLPAALAVVLVDSSLWILGVHATAALTTLKPLWESMLVQNMEAAANGARVLPHIATQPFFLWFVWQGGSGAALPLALLLLRARSTQLRGVGRLGFLPALCNINEPIVFGTPVVLNPSLAVPFFLAPAACALTAFCAFRWNWAMRPFLEVPWTLPAPLGAFLSTGGDVRALALEVFNLGLALAIYWPFVRRYDLRLLQNERDRQSESPEEAKAC
jgi:cellobiose PTS system EIIC component